MGVESSGPAELIHGAENVVNSLLQIISNAKFKIDACLDYTRQYLAIEIKQLKDGLIKAKQRGVKLRYLTEITKDNLPYCRQLMTMVDELRHLNGIKGNFYISEIEYGAPATFHEKGKSADMMIHSGTKEIVEHQQYVFDTIWNTSASAERKIKEIESNGHIDLGITEIIDHPSRTQEIFINLIKSAKSEILLVLPTVNAFIREYNIGAIQLLKDLSNTDEQIGKSPTISSKKRNLRKERGTRVRTRILTPTNDAVNKIMYDMNITPSFPSRRGEGELLSSPSVSSQNSNSLLQVRCLESLPKYNITTVTILVVDRKASLLIEKVDDSKESFAEAVGLSIYSTSGPTIMSILSVFENFWNQIELYEKLKENDKMQKEFINIAAHELRTPAQSILGYTELAKTDSKYLERNIQQFIDAVFRNAIRIHKLTQDILDVTRIESQTLKLNKTRFNLKEVITSVLEDIKGMPLSNNSDKLKIVYEINHRSKREDSDLNDADDDNIFITADRDRITQVISNLMSNALKFTNQGLIQIVVDVMEEHRMQGEEELLISVKDTGSGIDPEIFPRLFTKFSSRSFSGTGLGLYISKSIVEAHGGKIWAKNNDDQMNSGSTFYFSLPLSK